MKKLINLIKKIKNVNIYPTDIIPFLKYIRRLSILSFFRPF
jgi:hypothetical protein